MADITTQPVPAFGSTVTDALGRTGTAAFDPNTGKPLSPTPTGTLPAVINPVAVQPQADTTKGSNSPSTVLSNANIIENTIPDNASRLASLSAKGITVGTDNIARNADGTLTKAPFGAAPVDNGSISGVYSSGGVNYAVAPNNFSEDDPTNTLLQKMSDSLDASTKQMIDSISQKYDLLKSQQTQVNAATEAGREKSLLVSGSSRYAPISSTGIIGDEQTAGIQKIAQLDAEENQLIAQANQAKTTGDQALLEKALTQAESVRADKQAAATKVSDALSKQLNDQQTQKTQAARDTAVANLFAAGTTDPTAILKALNTDPSGKDTGANYTAAEVAATLKNIAQTNGLNGDISKLTGTTKDFFILKQEGVLPGNIANLPEDQQLKAYLDYIKPTKAPPGVPHNSPSIKKITLSEARTQHLPLSVVGMSETDLKNSFNGAIAPQWFIEKAQSEEGSVISPSDIDAQWQPYRQAYLKNIQATKPTSSGSSSGGRTI